MTITYALMEKLEDLAEAHPDRVKFLKRANVRHLIRDGDEVVGCEYEYQGANHKAHGPVILATGQLHFRLFAPAPRFGSSITGVV